MSQQLQPVRGMKDLLPSDYAIAEYVVGAAYDVSMRYGFKKMSTPIVEHSGVFLRSLGESSDVVSKEMYSLLDKGQDSLTLRPEFTAGVMRAFISNGLHHQLPLKFFSFGPCFRYDRPQAGRQRQFHHINCEFLGASSPYDDAEMLSMAKGFCEAWGILQDLTLEINSLGCNISRSNYHKALFEYFSDHRDNLSEDSKKRLDKNPMRILDSKDEGDKKIVLYSPVISSYYTDESRKYFDEVIKLLDKMNINYHVNQRLVRGLDYYCHTAFEFTTTKIGAQTSVLGGGRYDGLAKLMGGPDTQAFGFAAGLERVMLMRDFVVEDNRPCVVIPIGEESLEHAVSVVQKLRSMVAKPFILEYKGKIAKRMQHASKLNAEYVLFIGEDEIRSEQYKLKNMDEGAEVIKNISDIITQLKS